MSNLTTKSERQEEGETVIKPIMRNCIKRDCGKLFDYADPETRDRSTLRAFAMRYCPEHRLGQPSQVVFVNQPHVSEDGKTLVLPKRMVTRTFTSGTLAGLTHAAATSVPYTLGEHVSNAIGGSDYTITVIEPIVSTEDAPDSSHLVAIHERLSRQKARLSADPANPLLAAWVAQTEKELAAEFAHLGMSNESLDISDDDLLSELRGI